MKDRSDDDMYRRACEFVITNKTTSVSRLQLEFRVGYNTASRWLDRMIENGVITMPKGHLH